jgi:hypothetical protein
MEQFQLIQRQAGVHPSPFLFGNIAQGWNTRLDFPPLAFQPQLEILIASQPGRTHATVLLEIADQGQQGTAGKQGLMQRMTGILPVAPTIEPERTGTDQQGQQACQKKDPVHG